MSERRRPGLGRGLSALLEEIGNEDSSPAELEARGFRSQLVPLARIRPNPSQPRRRFDEASQAELIESVRQKGLLQPVLVRPIDGGNLEIVAGERRWRAARVAQLDEIPVVVRDLAEDEAFELALIENIQRQDLSPIEEARGYRHLMDAYDHTQQSVADMVGKSRSHVANLMRLLDLPERVVEMVDDGRLGMGHARALLGKPDAEALAERIVEEGLTAREAEAMGRAPSGRQPSGEPRAADPDAAELEALIARVTGAGVSLKPKGSGGKLVLSYKSAAELDAIVQRLTA